MPDYQVVILNGWLEFRRAWDALVRCPKTPYWKHRAALEAADKAAAEAFVKLDCFLTGGLYIGMGPFDGTAGVSGRERFPRSARVGLSSNGPTYRRFCIERRRSGPHSATRGRAIRYLYDTSLPSCGFGRCYAIFHAL